MTDWRGPGYELGSLERLWALYTDQAQQIFGSEVLDSQTEMQALDWAVRSLTSERTRRDGVETGKSTDIRGITTRTRRIQEQLVDPTLATSPENRQFIVELGTRAPGAAFPDDYGHLTTLWLRHHAGPRVAEFGVKLD